MRARTRVLVVDDDQQIRYLLRDILSEANCLTLESSNGYEALKAIDGEPPDLVILDVMMPGIDGLEVLRRIRKQSQIPVIILTALDDLAREVESLNLGADDYVVKPFGAEELMAHVGAVIRRTRASSTVPQPSFVCPHLAVNFDTRQVTMDGKAVALTRIESELLRELTANPGKVLTYRHLLSKVWGSEYFTETGYVHTYIKRLRHKLESHGGNPEHIVSFSKVGYIFREP